MIFQRQFAQRLSRGKIRTRTESLSRKSQQPPLQRWSQGRQSRHIHREASGPCSPASSLGPPFAQQFRRDARHLRLPPLLFAPRQLGHLDQMLAQPGIPFFKQR
jgi:hypothetical protein